MQFNYLVFDENSVIASFKYFHDAVVFIHALIPDFDSELFGYDILDMSKGDVIEFRDIKKIITTGCVEV